MTLVIYAAWYVSFEIVLKHNESKNHKYLLACMSVFEKWPQNTEIVQYKTHTTNPYKKTLYKKSW